MEHICSTWVPHFLQAKKMECRCSAYLENLAQISQDPDFPFHFITVDESWIHHCNPKMKCGSEAWLHSGEFWIKEVH